jgi:hypothetical protein
MVDNEAGGKRGTDSAGLRSDTSGDNDELCAALESELSRRLARPVRLARLDVRRSEYSTSFALDQVEVTLDDGTDFRLVRKDLSRQGLLPDARRVKPDFLYDPMREIAVYRQILARHELGTADCFGAVIDPRRGRFWLLLERVPGIELYQVGEFSVWCEVARWLAEFHSRFQVDAENLGLSAPLSRYSAFSYPRWLGRARAFLARNPVQSPEGVSDPWGRLAAGYEALVARLTTLPTTLIHGEFYASNILVQVTVGGLRVCPIDWEMAALGPGLIDLAALTAGGWSEGERIELARAYHEGLTMVGGAPIGFETLLADLDVCRLHLAVQWLGWAPGWAPPPEHAQDWLGEALRLARKLGL